ncbi:TolC family protein [Parabacteroides sp. AF18-52]|uniref:TolC family protein n=1 Tax=Parabacteroides TaxID=375288 RepID=UPI000EFFFFAF|nr:TolC family protein [Parabacteroides sp. AF18-52]RHR37892.1 TolC family protein [Parabacteroides sp. AF18-52]
MKTLLIGLGLSCCLLSVKGQQVSYTLDYYLESARENSPLIQDYRNQKEIEVYERQRLKALYTRSKVTLNGDYLFVPVISKDNGKTSFEWNPQDGVDYYGYDLGQSSGHFQAGVTWTQPLLGHSAYKVADEQARMNTEILNDKMHLEQHQLERVVTEQYLLCLLDSKQIAFADSVGQLLDRQAVVVRHLAESGLAKLSDLQLVTIERQSNQDMEIASRQSFYTHLMDLNMLCGIKDTAVVLLEEPALTLRLLPAASSAFMEQYRLDSLNTLMSLHSFNVQYKPQLHLFVDGGLRISEFTSMQKHFGMSAGLTFSWTLYDGKQKRLMEKQARARMNSIAFYKDNFNMQQELRRQQYLTELKTYGERCRLLQNRLAEYRQVLAGYRKEMQAGELSVIDYITVLRNRIEAEKEYILLETNRQLLINTFNYWNW